MVNKSVGIRQATLDDAGAIAEIHVRTWQSAYKDMLPIEALSGLAAADRSPMWERILGTHDPAVSVSVAEQEGVVVGFRTVGPPRDAGEHDQPVAELSAIYVEPRFHSSGIGAALLADAERMMWRTGARVAVLWVLVDNTVARRFYERNGWTRAGAVKHDTVLGVAVREIRYQKALNPPSASVETATGDS